MKQISNCPQTIFILFSFIAILGCDNGNGLFGRSENKGEAKANGSTVFEYLPDKKNLPFLMEQKWK